MTFSMQDLMARLPGSPGGQPQVAPNFNPQINKPQLATDVQVNKDIIKADKNQQLGLMLHALGGALRGDKNFVQNTMAIQTMQEGKKKEAERKKRYDEAIEKMDPNSPLYKFATVVGYEGVDKIAEAEFDLATRAPRAIPADIQKLQKFGLLKSKLDENSPNYDPSYTTERLNQDASILGVNAQLLDQSKNQYISDYMKEGRKQTSTSGRRISTDIELQKMAEESYNLVYGNDTTPTGGAVDDAGEEIIDLGNLGSS